MYRAVAAVTVSLYVLSGCNREPDHPHAGQVVEPACCRPFGDSKSSEPLHVSLYEYIDSNYHISGRSIAFEMPRYYMVSADNQEGGPQGAIYIAVYLRDNKPAQADQGPGTLLVTLGLRHRHQLEPSEADLKEMRGVPTMPGLMVPQTLQRMATDYCGYQVYQPVHPSGHPSDRDGIPDHASRDAAWPYTDAAVFARSQASGRVDPIITCTTHVNADGFPYCDARTSYRGWPMNLLFSGREVCRATGIISRTSAFLDRYRGRETQPMP